MQARKRISSKKTKTKRKTPARALSRQDIDYIKKLETRANTVFEAIKEIGKKAQDKKRIERNGSKIFGEKIEAITVFSQYMLLYPSDEQAILHPQVYRNLLQTLLEKKSTLPTNKYQKFLEDTLWKTYKQLQARIKAVQRLQY